MADLRELAGKATPGPWFSSGIAVTTDFDIGECGLLVADCEARIDEEAHSNVAANADYIAACDPATVLAMLDEIAALRAEVERLRWITLPDGWRIFALTNDKGGTIYPGGVNDLVEWFYPEMPGGTCRTIAEAAEAVARAALRGSP